MKKILLIIAVLCSILLEFKAQTTCRIHGGHLKVNGNTSLVLNNTQFINNGSFDAGSGTVVIAGNNLDTLSSIGGDSISTFYNLQINKTSNGSLLQNAIQVNNELQMTLGNLDLNGNNITLGTANGTIIDEKETSRITGANGGIISKTVTVNAPSNFNPGNLGSIISSTANIGTFVIKRGHIPQTTSVGTNGIARFYEFEHANNTDLALTAQFTYFDAELNGLTESNLGFWRQDSSYWFNPVTTSFDPNNNVITVDSITLLTKWTLAPTAPKIALKGFLQAAYSSTTQQMEDKLRMLNLIPTAEPYTGLGFTHIGGGEESVNPTIFSASSDEAIVDWVFIEVRDSANPTTVLATRSGLITKSGDVVDLDGESPLSFPGLVAGTNYHVALRHRNHLGAMTANPITLLGDGSSSYDFTDRSLATFMTTTNSQEAQYDNGVHTMLWAGDADGDHQIVYVGATDITPISAAVFLNPLNPGFDPTVAVSNVYDRADTNMDGQIVYVGNTDITPISASVFLHPLNLGTFDPLFILFQQLP